MDYQSKDHGMQESGGTGKALPVSGLIHKPLIRDTFVRIIIFYHFAPYYLHNNLYKDIMLKVYPIFLTILKQVTP